MKTKKAQIRTSWTAALAALGATAVMLPAQAQYQPESAGAQPPTSTHQPEMSNAPGQQGQDAAGSPGMGDSRGGASQWGQRGPSGSQQGQDAAGSAGTSGAQGGAGSGMQTDQRALTREEVQAETQAWREAGLLDSMMQGDDSSSWVSPEEQQRRDQLSREFQSQRGGMEPPGLGGGMGGGR